MTPRVLTAVEQLLKDLTEGALAYQRTEAAQKIGQLDESSIKVVAALLYAKDRDGNEDVRSAASAALHSPVHQAMFEQHSDEIREVVTALTRYFQKVGKSLPARKSHKSSTREMVAILWGITGLTLYLLFRGFSEVGQFSAARNPYEAAVVREGNAFIVLGMFGCVLLTIGFGAIVLTRHKRQ